MSDFKLEIDNWIARIPKGTYENTKEALSYLREKSLHDDDFWNMESAISTISRFVDDRATLPEIKAYGDKLLKGRQP